MSEAFRRRLLTVPGYGIAWLLWIGLMPLVLPLLAITDAIRRRGAVALRSAGFIAVYLSCEVVGIAVSAGLWLWCRISPMDEARWEELHFRLEAWWGRTLFDAMVRIFDLRLEVEGDGDLGRGPYLLLLRHVSSGDTLLASALVSAPFGMRLRYVLKRELLWDPCLDIVGNRLPNVFVDRDPEDSPREIQRVRALAAGLGSRDGLLIYPEGTRFTEARRSRLLERLSVGKDAKLLEYARSLECVLPPRPGGTLGLLDAAPGIDVVICSHTGFEGAASMSRLWEGALIHRTLRVRFERIPHREIPASRDARITWLREEWRKLDAWVARNQAP